MKAFSIFSLMKPCTFDPKLYYSKEILPGKIYFTSYIFSKKSFACISGNRNPKTETLKKLFIFQEVTWKTRKKPKKVCFEFWRLKYTKEYFRKYPKKMIKYPKISGLIYDIIKTKTFKSIYFSLYFVVSTIEYSLQRCCIMIWI